MGLCGSVVARRSMAGRVFVVVVGGGRLEGFREYHRARGGREGGRNYSEREREATVYSEIPVQVGREKKKDLRVRSVVIADGYRRKRKSYA